VDAVGVIQQHAQVADAAHAGFRADGRHAGLDAREAEDALLGFAAFPVVIDLLVRAAADAHAPAAALLLVDEDDAVLLTLVDGAARAGGRARRVEAVLAQARQVHHEGVLVLAVDVRLDLVEVLVLATLGEFGAENLLPVGAPLDFLHALAGDHRARPRHRLVLAQRRGVQVLVVEVERLVVVVDAGQVRVGEDVRQHAELAADARVDGAVGIADPAALPLLLVFPFLGVADAGLGLDVVEPGVFHAFAAGPDVLAGDRAGVAADALVQVQDHSDLGTNLHGGTPQMSCGSGCGRSFLGNESSWRYSSNVLRQRVRQVIAVGRVQPVDLVHLAHHDEFVAVAAHGAVVVEAVGLLGVAADHVGGLEHHAGHRVVVAAAGAGALGAGHVHDAFLGVVHHHHALLDALADHRAGGERAVGVEALDPVVVLDAD